MEGAVRPAARVAAGWVGPVAGWADPAAGGGRGGPPGAGGDDDPREAMRAILEPAEELVIAQSEAEIAVDEKFGRMRRLHPDGKKYKTDNGASEIKSYWKEGRLVVETKAGSRQRGRDLGARARREPADRQRELEGGFGPEAELKRIYDRPGAEGAAK